MKRDEEIAFLYRPLIDVLQHRVFVWVQYLILTYEQDVNHTAIHQSFNTARPRAV